MPVTGTPGPGEKKRSPGYLQYYCDTAILEEYQAGTETERTETNMGVTFTAYKDGKQLAPADWTQIWEEDEYYGRIPVNQNPWEQDFSCSNIQAVFQQVGLDFEDCGTWDILLLQDVRAKLALTCAIAQTSPDTCDAGTPPSEVETILGPAIDCGLRPGYFAEATTRLLTVVDAAIDACGKVEWY